MYYFIICSISFLLSTKFFVLLKNELNFCWNILLIFKKEKLAKFLLLTFTNNTLQNFWIQKRNFLFVLVLCAHFLIPISKHGKKFKILQKFYWSDFQSKNFQNYSSKLLFPPVFFLWSGYSMIDSNLRIYEFSFSHFWTLIKITLFFL